MNGIAGLLALLAASVSQAGEGGVVPEQAPQPAAVANAADDQLLLLAVQLDGATLSDSLTAYGDPNDPLIPLGELTRLLDLPLDVDPAAGIATGKLGESQRAITVDLKAGTALIAGTRIALIPPDSRITPTDIYLRASLVAKLLPVTIKPVPDEAALVLHATEKLPLQARQERAAQIAALGAAVPQGYDDVLRIDSPYRLLGRPAFDFGAELAGDSTRSGPVTRFEGRVAADVLHTSVNGYLVTDESGKPASARLTAQRRSAAGNLFGPLHATYAAIGDVYTPALALGPRTAGGAGVVMSSASLDDASVFEKTTINGTVPLGYDVELYVNDILTSARQGVQQGRYEFDDVPLVRGRNVVRVVMYGPRGERMEDTRVINVGGGQLPAGKTTFDVGATRQDEAVVPLDEDISVYGAKNRGSLRAVLSVSHGFTAGLTLNANAAVYSDTLGGRHRVLGTGLRTSLAGLALEADYSHDATGGNAAALGVAGRVLGINFVARHVEYGGDYADETNLSWDMARPMERYSNLNFDLSVPMGKTRVPFSGYLERAQFVDGGTTFRARGRATLTVAQTLVALGADYTRRTAPDSHDEQLTGTVAASRFIDYKWQLRATADYQVKPTARLQALGVTADRTLNDRYRLRLGVSRSFDATHDLSLQAGVTARLPFAEATVGGNYSTGSKTWRVGLQLNFGLAFDPAKGRYRATPPGPASGASAAVDAFVDANANGQRDPGEEPVPGITIQGGGRQVTTDADGHAFITGLGDGASGTLRADTSKADTVFLSAPPQAIAFEPRAGDVLDIPYPMVPTSEVSVKLTFRQPGGQTVGLSAVRARLVSDKGVVVAGSTEFDGTLVLDQVKPGHYRLELDPDQAGRLGMTLAHPIDFVVGPQGNTMSVAGEVLFARKGG